MSSSERWNTPNCTTLEPKRPQNAVEPGEAGELGDEVSKLNYTVLDYRGPEQKHHRREAGGRLYAPTGAKDWKVRDDVLSPSFVWAACHKCLEVRARFWSFLNKSNKYKVIAVMLKLGCMTQKQCLQIISWQSPKITIFCKSEGSSSSTLQRLAVWRIA